MSERKVKWSAICVEVKRERITREIYESQMRDLSRAFYDYFKNSAIKPDEITFENPCASQIKINKPVKEAA